MTATELVQAYYTAFNSGDMPAFLDLLADEADLAERRAQWAPLPARYERGVLSKYARLVGSASRGAVTD